MLSSTKTIALGVTRSHVSLHRVVAILASIITTIGLATCSMNDLSASDSADRPNIVLIMADDMGYECLSSNGSESYHTPRLDALAKGGMRFLHCHSQPICTPSRVQIMTGIYNNRNYLRFGILDPQATTFGHIMKEAGYKTCVVGKWQLLGGFDGPSRFGFDEYCLWQLTRRPSRYVNPGLEINGKQVDYRDGEYGPDVVSDYLCDFMERNKEGPFFAYYPMILPHWPFEPTPDSADYDPKAKGKKGHGENQYFDDMVAYTDKIVGKVADKLDALGIRKNTLLLFTGDNGTYTGITSQFNGRRYPGGKGSTRDNGTHVPFIASWPGVIEAGKVSDALVDFSDMLPTIAEFASAEVPEELSVQGISFASHLRGEPYTGRDAIYCWYERNGKRGKESQHARDRTHKLYANGRFFNVANDFAEKHPLDVSSLPPDVQPVYSKLKSALAQQLAITEKATKVIQQRKENLRKKKQKAKVNGAHITTPDHRMASKASQALDLRVDLPAADAFQRGGEYIDVVVERTMR